jgi:acyl-CoA synthetase (AMP-forming)/AMP-acid ligase II
VTDGASTVDTDPQAAEAEVAAAVNIAHHLPRQAAERPHQRALVVASGRGPRGRTAYAHLTFAQLDALTDRYAHALTGAGVARGDRVLILVKPGFELIAVIYAVFKLGGVAVFIDPGMGLKGLVNGVSEVAPKAFVGVSKAQGALAVLGRRALASMEHRFVVGGGLGWGARNLDALAEAAPEGPFPMVQTRAAEDAAILFTSGSTGPAKGVLYAHGMFDAQVRLLRTGFGIQPGEVDLPGLPIFALFSVALGATTVFPEMDPTRPAQLDPARWVEFVQDQGVTYSFGSPAIWTRVARHCVAHGIRLPSMKRVLMAGAPVPPGLQEDLLERILSPEATTYTPYGATEALPVTSVTGRELRETFAVTRAGGGTCVGRPLPAVEVKVIAIDDGPIARLEDATELGPNQRGELVVTGPSVTHAYCERPEATRAAKMRDDAGRVWHRMGDMGSLDDDGRIWFLGRKSHRVEVGGQVLYPVACEAIFNEHPKVFRAALVGLGERPDQRPAIVVEPEQGAWPAGAEREAFVASLKQLAAAHEHTKAIDVFLFHRSFPVDLRHNAKIRRGQLAAWAAKQGA